MASFPPDPITLEAARLHSALPACARRKAARWPDWLYELKFDGYRVIARKDGAAVRLWARTTSDYSKAFTRIRDEVAALPVHSAVLDGEAIVMPSADRCDFEALRSRDGQAEAVLVAYDIMEPGCCGRKTGGEKPNRGRFRPSWKSAESLRR